MRPRRAPLPCNAWSSVVQPAAWVGLCSIQGSFSALTLSAAAQQLLLAHSAKDPHLPPQLCFCKENQPGLQHKVPGNPQLGLERNTTKSPQKPWNHWKGILLATHPRAFHWVYHYIKGIKILGLSTLDAENNLEASQLCWISGFQNTWHKILPFMPIQLNADWWMLSRHM